MIALIQRMRRTKVRVTGEIGEFSADMQISLIRADGRIAIVTHGGVLDCVYRRAASLPLKVLHQYALLNTSLGLRGIVWVNLVLLKFEWVTGHVS